MEADGASAVQGEGAATRVRAYDIALACGITSLGVALRVVHWHKTHIMFNDGPRFLLQAQEFAAGQWERALGEAYHPLYALAVAALRLALWGDEVTPGQWEQAAVAVSVLAGAAAILVFYFFLLDAFGRPAAAIGAALLACSPYAVEFSADVQSDGLHQLLFLAALTASWFALRGGSCAWAGWAGAFAGLAYLTRPEGLGVAVAAGLVALLRVAQGRFSPAQAAPWLAALLLGLLLATGPYLIWLRSDTGEWRLTQKKSVGALAGVEPAARAASPLGLAPGAEVPFSPEVNDLRHTWKRRERRMQEQSAPPPPGPLRGATAAVLETAHAAVSGLRPEVLLVAVLGMVRRRGRPGLRGQLLLAVAAIYFALVWALAMNYGYVSRRHTLTPALLVLGYAAEAVPVVGAALLRGGRRLLGRPGAPRAAAAVALGLALLVAAALSKQWRPQRAPNVAERAAAEWVQARSEPGRPVASGKRRVAYYAGAPWFPLRKIPGGAPLVPALRSNGVRYLVADEKDVQAYPDLARPESVGLDVVYRAQMDGGSATVFEIVTAAGG